jgi:hypothetical protein
MSDTSSTTYGGQSGTSGRHPVDIGHLVMGVAFMGMVGVWALFESGIVEGTDLNWFLPLPWLAAGAAGLAAVTVNSRRRARRGTGVEDAAYSPAWGYPYESYAPPYETPYETPYGPTYEPPYDSTDQPAPEATTETTPETTDHHRPDTSEENR